MTATDTGALRELLARATPGEWRWSENGNIVTDMPLPECDPEVAAVYSEHDDDSEPANSALICAMHNALPALLTELDAARARIAELEKDTARYRWLRNHAIDYPYGDDESSPWCVYGPNSGAIESRPIEGDELDAAIDAAMARDGVA